MDRIMPILLLTLGLTLVVVRRARPQPVRPRRLLINGLIVAVLLGLAALGASSRLFSDKLALLLAPAALVVGAGIGALLVRTMRFWTSPRSGELWMRGGMAFAVILIAALVLRIGVRVAAASDTGQLGGAHGVLVDISSDLLLLWLGMWLTRGALVYQRWRRHQASPAAPLKQPATG